MPTWWIIPIAAAFILSVLFTDMVRIAAVRWGILDAPNKPRKLQREPVALLGGIAIYFAFALTTLVVLFYSDHFTSGEMGVRHFVGLLFGGWILIAGGILDDKYDLKPYQSLFFPILACVVAVASGIGVSKITNPFGEPGDAFQIGSTISGLITFVWLLGMIYTTKLLDGLDGLATGVSAIGTFMIAMLALSVAYFQPDVALLALIAFAVLAGFLLWNFNPAQIYLGEGGSTLVGFLVGSLAIISGSKIATALLVVGIPALDVVFVLFDRWKNGQPLFSAGDRRHLHHRLMDAGLSQRQVVTLYYTVAIAFGVTTLIFESWQKLLALSVLFVMMLILVKRLSAKKTL